VGVVVDINVPPQVGRNGGVIELNVRKKDALAWLRTVRGHLDGIFACSRLMPTASIC